MRVLRTECNKLGQGWWRVIAVYSNGTEPLADVIIDDKGVVGLHFHRCELDPRTGKRWKSAREALEFIGANP